NVCKKYGCKLVYISSDFVFGNEASLYTEESEAKPVNYYGKTKFTANAKDWTLFLSIDCHSIEQAQRIEHHIKRMKSKKYIQNLLTYPEISIKLLLKYL
ncbi:MAG: sugar nucleotide-binding protein, partial [Bacteroidetes bacterium]|nr:sugar nucleotide-binding protein [Bacteroidota bacterium]